MLIAVADPPSTSRVTSAGVGTNLVYTHTVPPCAKELLITVKQPTNDAASTLEWFVYGE